ARRHRSPTTGPNGVVGNMKEEVSYVEKAPPPTSNWHSGRWTSVFHRRLQPHQRYGHITGRLDRDDRRQPGRNRCESPDQPASLRPDIPRLNRTHFDADALIAQSARRRLIAHRSSLPRSPCNRITQLM